MKETALIVASLALLFAYLIGHFNDPKMLRLKLDPNKKVNDIAIPLDPKRVN